MAFIKKPVTGMRDILPIEKSLREKTINTIRDTYLRYGFLEIETPIVEHMENLSSRQGGENEKLIFKVLKRGDKLKRALKGLLNQVGTADKDALLEGEISLSEEGLRYDLTVPLSRYYADNYSFLPNPFKALQIGSVFRADRPQKGRFREFTQCDIDILGDGTTLAEKELILATSEALDRIGFSKYNFYIAINDRRLLFEMLKFAAFPEGYFSDALIILDKKDKIGTKGVREELIRSSLDETAVDKLIAMFDDYTVDAKGARSFGTKIGSDEALSAGESIAGIIEFVSRVRTGNIRLIFDPTLVRGMGYYTGTIFEIKTDSFDSSVGGGGRYDKMVGKFTGRDVPAVGFSIGFERIMSLLLEDLKDGGKMQDEKSAWLLEKGLSYEKLSEIFKEALSLRDLGKQISLTWMAKNKKFQKKNLEDAGYRDIREFYVEELKN